jgi:hypothetical protein
MWGCGVQESIESLAAKTVANSRKPPYPANKTEQDLMKHLLLLGALMLPLSSAHAQAQKIKCPGENTVEMRYCAGQSWERSTDQLKQKLPRQMLQQWQDTTRAVCAHAYAPYKDGTIYPQLVVGCDDHLNRGLLKELQPLNNKGDVERAP